jgi:hypothetical protein
MTHLNEKELLAYRDGEAAQPQAVEAHLRGCEACRASYDELERVLRMIESAPTPERDEDYGAQLWQRIGGRLDERKSAAWQGRAARWGWAAALAVAAVGIVLAIHLAPRPQSRPQPVAPVGMGAAGADSTQARERILLDAVGNHLDRAQVLLLELTNAGAGGPEGAARPAQRPGPANLSREQELAQDLLLSNRLYRLTAEHLGDRRTTTTLDALEPVLVQVAHSPERASPAELAGLHERIAAGDYLFKLRVLTADVRQREIAAARQAAFPVPEQKQEGSPLP